MDRSTNVAMNILEVVETPGTSQHELQAASTDTSSNASVAEIDQDTQSVQNLSDSSCIDNFELDGKDYKVPKKATLTGKVTTEIENGSKKKCQKIFKIVKERDIEIDSEDEGDQDRASGDSLGIRRKCKVDNELYKSVYRRSKQLVKVSVNRSF